MTTNKTTLSRRELLRKSAMLAVTGSTIAAMNGRMNLIGSALAADNDYSSLNDEKSLVCVFLYGGSDSLSFFPPVDEQQYSDYAKSRGTLAVARRNMLVGSDGLAGFHPQLSKLRDRYDRGTAAVVSNVGNLIAPVTRSEFLAETAPVPADLFAHNHQQEQTMKSVSSRATGAVSTGWGGRMADMLMHSNSSELPPTFSLAGTNFWLPGSQTSPISLNPVSGLTPLPYLDATANEKNAGRDKAINAILDLQRRHLMRMQAANTHRRAQQTSQHIGDVLANAPQFNTPVDTQSSLATQLRMVARLIASRNKLGMKRQVFFVGMGGWDTHDNQIDRLQYLLADLDASLSGFQDSLEELRLEQSVTTFTHSDFGRTLSINGDGTDHGWGGNSIVMGGAVQGGRTYGDPIEYVRGGANDSGSKGRMIPTTSLNQYSATLAKWMGIGNSDLMDIFPDLRNHGDSWDDDLHFMA